MFRESKHGNMVVLRRMEVKVLLIYSVHGSVVDCEQVGWRL